MSDGPFVTINPAVRYGFYNVVFMRYDDRRDEHYAFRCSAPLPLAEAQRMAREWAAQSSVEIR